MSSITIVNFKTLQVLYTTQYTSIKIIKNEVGCRDDTVPKTVDTRRHCEEHAAIFRNPQKPRCRDWVVHALTPPRSAFLYLQFLARCHPYILLHFYTCFTNFLSRLSLDCSARRDDITCTPYVCIRTYAHAYAYCAREVSKTEVVTSTCYQDKMASV